MTEEQKNRKNYLSQKSFIFLFSEYFVFVIKLKTITLQKTDDNMSERECIEKLSKVLFWDIDIEQVNMDSCPSQIIQRVLEYGTLDDWRIIKTYYGLDKIVSICRKLRSLDPIALSFISAISHTDKKEYRCYHNLKTL